MRVLLLLFLLLVASVGYSQNYFMNATLNGQTINTCSGNFYDSGGSAGTYSPNQNYTATFCPGVAGQSIKITFNQWVIGTGDQLCVFDGINTTAPLFGCFSSTTPASQIGASAANTTGCITLQWTSDASTNGSGWWGVVECTFPCQTILSQLLNSVPVANPPVNGYIDICEGESVFLAGQGSYPQNGLFYTQSDALSNFVWTIEGQQYPGSTVNYTFNQAGGYRVQLTITDTAGCKNTNQLSQRIRVSPDPYFAGTNASSNTICIGDTVTLQGVVTPVGSDFAPPISRGDSIFLPDGSGVCYNTSLLVSDFLPGQTITNVNDLVDICINMEHSYMGDLDITITCPTGQTISLHQNPGGGGTHLGVPIDIDANLNPGQGFDYCWAMNAPNPTWTNWVAANCNSVPCTLPAGTYTPAQSFAGLVGCQLNGNWTITVCDSIPSDNGYIFNWGINFNPSLYPGLEPFTPQVTTKGWEANPTIINNVGDTVITVVPISPGTAAYTFSMTNSFGCTYDTTVNITVLPFTNAACLDCDAILPAPSLADTSICTGQSVGLNATVSNNLADVTYTYLSGAPIPTGINLDAALNVIGVTPTVINSSSIVSVCVDVTHPFNSDVDMFLISPSGQSLELSTDNGGSGDNYTNTCFTPTATTPITSGTPPYTGNFLPEGSWSNLNNSTANGNWILRIVDDSPGFSGTLNSWSITFSNPHNISYAWSPPTGLSCTNCPNPTATPTTTTQYVVTVTDNYNCLKRDTVVISMSQPLPAPVVNCGTATSNSLQVNWTSVAGATGYEVNIGNSGWISPTGNLSHSIQNLNPNQTVEIQVRAMGNCNISNLIDTVYCTTQPCLQTLQITNVQNVSCFGGNNGSATAVATGGIAPYTFTLNSGGTQANGTFNNLAAGNYAITVTDAVGCTNSANFTISQPTALSLNPTVVPVSCFGGNDGWIVPNATGGTAPYSYLWNDNSTNDSLINATAGSYSVTITDSQNCTFSSSFSINQPNPLATTMTINALVDCDENTGTLTVAATGGVSPYAYLWSNNAQTTATALPSGTHFVTVTDANNCTRIDSATLIEPQPIQFTVSHTDLLCHPNNAVSTQFGSITVNVTSGATYPNYEYSVDCGITWSASNHFISLAAGSYGAMVRYANGLCSTPCVPVEIAYPDSLDLSFSTVQVTCFGLSDGAATVSTTGGVAPYSYLWNANNQTTATATNLAGGFFEITVTDAANCQTSDTVYVYAPVIINIDTIYSTPALCFGGNQGSVGAAGSGGTGGKTYRWATNPIQFGTPINNLSAGVYSVTITDQQGCSAIDSIAVLEPDSIQIAFSVDSLACYQDGTGTATATVVGGTSPYVYNWENGQNTATITGLNTGIVSLTITDANNCFQIDSVFVPEPLPISVNFNTSQVSCNGNADGNATALPSGGTPSYAYLWENGQTTATAINLSGGLHFVTITDANGCLRTDSTDVLERAALATTLSSTQVTCFGNADGTATVVATGGTGNYSYLWQNNQITATATGLLGGTYAVTVTDSDNCPIVDSVVVVEPQPLSVALSATDVSCFGSINGTAIAQPSGGTLPYFYQWSNSVTNTPTVSGLAAGLVSVTITDQFNCQTIGSIQVGQPTPVQIITTSTPVSCFGGNNGTATAIASGGVGNYTYNWLNLSQNTPTATNLAASNYVVVVTDANGCTANTSITVSQPTALGVTSNVVGVSCFGLSDGGASVAPLGGIGPYSYQWSNGTTLSSMNQMASGAYTVTVTDANGCHIVDSVFIPQPSEVVISMSSTPVSCNGGSDGTASVVASGGTPPYAYAWSSTTLNSNVINNLNSGTYTVTVTDLFGCSVVGSIAVTEPPVLQLTINQLPATCYGFANGEAYLSINGGVGNYSILWNTNPPYTTDTVINLVGGNTYQAFVTDGNGCIATQSVQILPTAPIIAQTSSQNTACFGGNDGTATVSTIGGIPPFTYLWDANANNQTTATATGLAKGNYTVTATDANGCQTSASVGVGEPTALAVSFDLTNVSCFGEATGEATATVSGGTPAYALVWETNNGTQNGSTATGLTAGQHFVLLTDANNCILQDTITLSQPANPLTLSLVSESPSCFGEADGTIQAAPNGGTSPYLFRLDEGSFTTSPVLIGIAAGDYTVTVKDLNGCQTTDNITVSQPSELQSNAGADILIDFGNDAQLNGIASGGTQPFLYIWEPTDSLLSCSDCANPVVSGLSRERIFTLLVTDANGCTDSDVVVVRVRKERNVFIANAFTPNADGNNDLLLVQGDEQAAIVQVFRVYDRWGELVFEVENVPVNDLNGGWDGTFKGEPMNASIFAWYAEVEFIDGVVITYQGSTYLIR